MDYFLILVCSSSVSSQIHLLNSAVNLVNTTTYLSKAKFDFDLIQDITLDFSIPFFNDSNVASRE